MKILRYLLFTALLLAAAVLLMSCSGEKKAWLETLSSAEKREFESGKVPEQRIENLKKGISFYESEVERTVKASKQIGIYYRMLTAEYMSLEMYNEALKNAENSIKYFPTSPLLYYYGAVSAAQMAESVRNPSERKQYLDVSEQYYLRAVGLDPVYTEALYGLSVLYIFELDRPLDAEPLLETIMRRSRTNFDAMFLLARVRILKGDVEGAVELYSVIEEKSPDDEQKRSAADNRRRLLGGAANG